MEDYLKRLLDILCSFLLLVISIPLFFIMAILIKIDSKGPVFFLQKRCGRNRKEFFMYKFRTMVKDAETLKKRLKNEMDGPMFKLKTDPRITRLGRILRKLSLDELPQLLNILKGEMSLVGPRPLADEEMVGNDIWREIRLSVRPGMTGLWQIMGRDSGKFSDWITYDTEYVQKRSLFMDLKILFLTITTVLCNKGL
ncbi:MAG: sugar transferase [Planctomycetes bacterium]|uniref:sugar transferase n=1 Tax=Candidatus Wunengus sp. YC65 TaxID=3367701 RepID=UPI001DFDAB64|nr:sugar transferase [Planctomycetota bacterium]